MAAHLFIDLGLDLKTARQKFLIQGQKCFIQAQMLLLLELLLKLLLELLLLLLHVFTT